MELSPPKRNPALTWRQLEISVCAKLAISDRQFFASSTKVMLKAVFEIS